MRKLFLVIVAVCMTGITLAAAPLFENGKSVWRVVIPADAGKENTFAAGEFVSAIKKIAGVELPVIQAESVEGENNVVIGSLKNKFLIPQIAETIQLRAADNMDDVIAVHTVKGNLYLAGNNPRSAAYAVYHFLREYLGVRWFWPGPDGEFMPAKQRFDVPAIACNFRSPFRYRSLTPGGNHGNRAIELALFRMYNNAGFQNGYVIGNSGAIRTVGSHSVCMEPKDFKKYPERFALIGGKRSPKGISGCWSNEEFTKYVVDRHAKWLERSRGDLLCAFPADVTQRCECPSCTKLENRSSRWFVYYAKLIKEIRKQYNADFRAAGLAYQEFQEIPDVQVEGLEYVEYCLYDRCYVHPMDDPACAINRSAMKKLDGWQEKAPMGIYGYEFDVFNKDMYVPMQNQFALSAKKFRDMKMVRLKTEYPAAGPDKKIGRLHPQYVPSRLSAYVFNMTGWDPDLDVNKLVRDYCNYVYAAGADAMYEYHTSMAKYWDSMKLHLNYFGNTPNGASINLLDPERIEAMNALFVKAEKAIAAMPDEIARKRAEKNLAIDKHYFGLWEKTYRETKGKAYHMTLPQLPAGSGFDTLSPLPVTSRKGKHAPTDIRMYRSEKGLHFRVINRNAGLRDLVKGESGKDVPFWDAANVEFFLDFNDGMPFRQLGVTLAGGTFDAIGSDCRVWNPEWKAVVTVDEANDLWMVECFLPFTSFGGKVPEKGSFWKINIIRNYAGKSETCGFPAPVYRDLDLGAYITF